MFELLQVFKRGVWSYDMKSNLQAIEPNLCAFLTNLPLHSYRNIFARVLLGCLHKPYLYMLQDLPISEGPSSAPLEFWRHLRSSLR